MLLKACVNGVRRPEEHPALPVTAAELAEDVAAVAAAGAGAVHLHVKDAEGADTLAAGPLAEVLAAVRAAAPAMPVGVTTGAWAVPDPLARVAAIRRWTLLPDFASVNWHEAGADEVAETLLARGVAVEAGLWHVDAVQAWCASPVRDRCFRVLLELPDGLNAAETAAEADRLLRLLADGVAGTAAASIEVLLHGEGSSCWPALRYAAHRRLAARIGLEDAVDMPDGTPAPSNAALVATAKHVVSEHSLR